MASSKQLLARIRAIGPLVHGSLVEMKRTCGKAGCKCARGERHSAFYLSRRIEGRTRLEHISRGDVETVRRWQNNYKRLLGLIEELTTALLRELRESRR
jgi:hypothetical protein